MSQLKIGPYKLSKTLGFGSFGQVKRTCGGLRADPASLCRSCWAVLLCRCAAAALGKGYHFVPHVRCRWLFLSCLPLSWAKESDGLR